MKHALIPQKKRPPELVLVSVASQLTVVHEVLRTEGATALLDRWFSASREAPGLPAPIREALLEAAGGGARRWQSRRETSALYIAFVPIEGPISDPVSLWALMINERESARSTKIPTRFREVLTRRECDAVAGVARGWDNRLIADDMGCSEATVKKHLQHVFDKLGVSSRTALIAAMSGEETPSYY